MSKVNVKRVHHLGFVVHDLEATLAVWEDVFGITAEVKENPELQVRLGAFELAGIRFVFNESTHPGSRWAKYLDENGEGLEHAALEVDDIKEVEKAAREAGIPLRFAEHKEMHGLLTNFIDHDTMHATAVEFMGPAGNE